MPYQLVADLILALHFTIVLFVVAGLVLILAGNLFGWAWVNGRGFRYVHLAAISIVVAEAWLGIACPLTTWEMDLRARTGAATYDRGFIEYWLQRLLYYDAPAWAFLLAYSLFGLAVVLAWWRFPPGRGHGK